MEVLKSYLPFLVKPRTFQHNLVATSFFFQEQGIKYARWSSFNMSTLIFLPRFSRLPSSSQEWSAFSILFSSKSIPRCYLLFFSQFRLFSLISLLFFLFRLPCLRTCNSLSFCNLISIASRFLFNSLVPLFPALFLRTQ